MSGVVKELQTRWDRAGKGGVTSAMQPHFAKLLSTTENLRKQFDEIGADKMLSEAGRADKRSKASEALAPVIAQAGRTIETARRALDEQRRALLPKVRDKTDVAAALLRQEIRADLRTKSPGEMVTLLTDKATDTNVLEAALEAPYLVKNIPPESRDRIFEQIVENTAGPALSRIRDQDEAIAVFTAALQVSRQAVAEGAGVATGAFEKWLARVAPSTPEEVASDVAQFTRDTIKGDALAMPYADRKTLIDELLAANTREIAGA
jgi:hypothetical protein